MPRAGGAFWFFRLGQDHAQASWARKTCFALSAQMAEHDPSRVAGAAGGLAGLSSCLALRATRLAVVASLTMGVMSCAAVSGLIAQGLCVWSRASVCQSIARGAQRGFPADAS